MCFLPVQVACGTRINLCCSNAFPQQAFGSRLLYMTVTMALCKILKHCIHSVCRFMEVGWPVLNVWLAEAKKTQDVAVLVEVMQVKI